MLAFLPRDDRRQDHQAGALVHLQDAVDDLLDGLLSDRAAAIRAVRPPGPGVEQPQVVVDLSNRAHGGSRVVRHALLVDGNRRR